MHIRCNCLQVLVVVDPELADQPMPLECPDGVTPPMRKARSRHFRPPINLPADMMRDAVNDVIEMLNGRCGCSRRADGTRTLEEGRLLQETP